MTSHIKTSNSHNALNTKQIFPVKLFIIVFFLYSILSILLDWNSIITRSGHDPDDQLRMVQLRDFLNGQSWFDTTQYRMNAPQGAPMHWSRLIELPLAFLIILLSPLFGQAVAEMIAGTLIPLFSFVLAIYFIAKITAKLAQGKAVNFAIISAIVSVAVVTQFRPMRIDHHGWQIAMACLSLYTIMWRNKNRAGIVMGLAMAIWTHISLEGLPLAAAFFVLLGWRWVFNKSDGRQLLWAISSFALGSTALFFGTQMHGLLAPVYCDTISTSHIAAIVCAATIMLPAIYNAPQDWRIRLIVTIIAGAAVVITLLSLAPQCANGAFSSLDPLVRIYWYNNVTEGLPVWHQGWDIFLLLYTGPITAIGALIVLWRLNKISHTPEMHAVIFFMLFSFCIALMVFRAISLAAFFAIPVTSIALANLYNIYCKNEVPSKRIAAVAGILFLITPGIFCTQIYNMMHSYSQPKVEMTEAKLAGIGTLCKTPESVAALAKLPVGRIETSFDLGPMVLLTTPHSVLASSHHRNELGMHDHIQIFRLPPALSEIFVRKHAINYFAVCPGEAEMENYRIADPHGLWSALSEGKTPDWLQRLPEMGKGIQVWRVKPNLKDT